MAAPTPLPTDESHDLFRKTCERFARERIAPNAFEWEEAGLFPRELYDEAAELGILGAGYPEEYGGGGGDGLYGLIGLEALLEGGSSGVVAGLGSHGIAMPPLMNLGTDEQKQRFLPGVISGKKIAALAITEPGTGSDVSGITTRAVRDGDDYVISGAKTFITSGTRADYIMTLTRTGEDKHGGLTFFIVENDMKGYSVSRALKKTGWWASDTGELSFDEVRVPVANRMGEEGSGFVALMQNFQNERLALAYYGHATADIVFRDALEYTKERKAFGRPIAGFQVTRHKLARMATEIAAARAFNYAVTARVLAGEYLVGEVSMAKNYASDVAVRVCYDAVQLLGGMGYMRETRVERLSRDARILPIGGGTTEIMNEIIAKHLGL